MMKLWKRFEGVVGAANELGPEIKEWLDIPYGVYPHSKGPQHFSEKEAASVVATFNEKGKPVPFYIGHPDIPEFYDKYRDHAAYGWIEEMVANEDRLSLRVNWTEAGKELLSNKAFRWWSPLFMCRWIKVANEKALAVGWLKSCGLTQEPRMDGLEPVVNEDDADDKNEEETGNEGEVNMNLFERIKALIGKNDIANEDDLVGWISKALAALRAIKEAHEARYKAEDAAYQATPNEEEVLGVFERLMTVIDGKHQTALEAAANEVPSATKSQLAALQEEVEAANEAAKAAKAAHTDLLINAAIGEGRVTPAQKEAWQAKFAADFEAAANELAAAVGQMHVDSVVKDAKNRSAAAVSKQDQMIAAANEVMNAEKCDWPLAWAKAAKANPELFGKSNK